MNTRYQVFISSTFQDLAYERQLILKSLLDLYCIPAGMEMFPAVGDRSWTLIERVIDDSDYYVLIVGGRYGSVDETGISFTEREYDYAVKSGKNVLAFLHVDADSLPRRNTELNADKRVKLDEFITRVRSRHNCKGWKGPDDLVSSVSQAICHAIHNVPGVGWTRANVASFVGDRKGAILLGVKAIIDSSNLPMHFIDTKMIVRHCNEYLASLVDATRAAIIDRPLSDLIDLFAARVDGNARESFVQRQRLLVNRAMSEVGAHMEDSGIMNNADLVGNPYSGVFGLWAHADKIVDHSENCVLGMLVLIRAELLPSPQESQKESVSPAHRGDPNGDPVQAVSGPRTQI